MVAGPRNHFNALKYFIFLISRLYPDSVRFSCWQREHHRQQHSLAEDSAHQFRYERTTRHDRLLHRRHLISTDRQIGAVKMVFRSSIENGIIANFAVDWFGRIANLTAGFRSNNHCASTHLNIVITRIGRGLIVVTLLLRRSCSSAYRMGQA